MCLLKVPPPVEFELFTRKICCLPLNSFLCYDITITIKGSFPNVECTENSSFPCGTAAYVETVVLLGRELEKAVNMCTWTINLQKKSTCPAV